MNKLTGAIVQKEQSFFSEQIYEMINREEIYYGVIFFRHAQGKHVMNPPESLQMTDPYLTEVGVWQAEKLIIIT